MEAITKTIRTYTTISGTIQGSQVSINYEVVDSKPPVQISVNCTVVSLNGTLPINNGPMFPNNDNTNVSITISQEGQKNINVTGKLSVTEVTSILEEMETEINNIYITFI